LVGGGVRGGGREAPAGPSGDDMDVVDGVANEEGVVGRGVEDAVPVGVAGGVDRPEPSGDVELVAVVKRPGGRATSVARAASDRAGT